MQFHSSVWIQLQENKFYLNQYTLIILNHPLRDFRGGFFYFSKCGLYKKACVVDAGLFMFNLYYIYLLKYLEIISSIFLEDVPSPYGF